MEFSMDDIKLDPEDVQVFYAPKLGEYIVRKYHETGARIGDDHLDHYPEDEELRQLYGDRIHIHR